MDTARSNTWTASRPTAVALLALAVAAAALVAFFLLGHPLSAGSNVSTGGAVTMTHEQAPDARDRNTLANALPHQQAPDARDRNADPGAYLSTGSR